MTEPTIHNLVIIGGGPAGLSAAISAGSELPNVVLLDSGKKTSPKTYEAIIGGQIRETARIENHPGVLSASGRQLIETFVKQAEGMGVDIHCPVHASSIEMLESDLKCVTTREGQKFITRAVILANGLSYRRMPESTDVDTFLGSGVKYGAMDIKPGDLGPCNIGIVGAANSAGQAVLKLAENTDASITIFVRGKKTIHDQMSQYLIDRIQASPQIKVMQDVEVVKATGDSHLEQVQLKHGDGTISRQTCDHMFVFIGAMPKAQWLRDTIVTNERGFILTGDQLGQIPSFQQLPHETSMSGVFAAGDIQQSMTKRVTAATGDGSSAVSALHRYLALIASGERKSTRLQRRAG